jgi:hypothetical protein
MLDATFFLTQQMPSLSSSAHFLLKVANSITSFLDVSNIHHFTTAHRNSASPLSSFKEKYFIILQY